MSPILLLCFNARKGPSARVPPALGPFTPPTLARTIDRGHCSSVFTPFRLHLPLLPSLISVSLLLCHREERERLSKCRFCPDRMQRLGRTSRSNLDLVGVFRKGSRDTFLLEGLKARCTGEHTGCTVSDLSHLAGWHAGTHVHMENHEKVRHCVSHQELSLLLTGGRQN